MQWGKGDRRGKAGTSHRASGHVGGWMRTRARACGLVGGLQGTDDELDGLELGAAVCDVGLIGEEGLRYKLVGDLARTAGVRNQGPLKGQPEAELRGSAGG